MKRAVLLFLILAGLVTVDSALAVERGKDGYFHTGQGKRQKAVAFLDVDVYEIHHYVKELPPAHSKRAVIDLDVDKRIEWKMLRDVGAEKLQDALRNGYEMNGFKDEAAIGKFVAAFQRDLAEGARVTIRYDAAKKATTISVQGGGTATVGGIEFMKATWSVWFGKIDQPELGDAMISLLP